MRFAQRLRGKVAVITGAGSGMGAAMARRFTAEGAKVVVADVDPTGGQAVAKEVGGLFVRTNASDEADVRDLYATVARELGGIDVCCNNAGISPLDDGSILDTELDAWRRVQEVNLTSVYPRHSHF